MHSSNWSKERVLLAKNVIQILKLKNN